MTRPVKPGDLAMIVGMVKQAENNGAIVLVGPETRPGEVGPSGLPCAPSKCPGPLYRVTSQGRMLKASRSHRGRRVGYFYTPWRVLHSRYLVPLPPPDEVEQFDQALNPKETAMTTAD